MPDVADPIDVEPACTVPPTAGTPEYDTLYDVGAAPVASPEVRHTSAAWPSPAVAVVMVGTCG